MGAAVPSFYFLFPTAVAVKRLSPRRQALLWLGAVAFVTLALGFYSLLHPTSLSTETDQISRQLERTLTSATPSGYLLLACICIWAAITLWRSTQKLPSTLAEVEPVPWTPPQVALLAFSWLVAQAIASIPFAPIASSPLEKTPMAIVISVTWTFGTLFGVLLPLSLYFKNRLKSPAQVGLCLPARGKEFQWGFLAFLTFPALVTIGLALTSLIGKFNPIRTNPVFPAAFSSTSPFEWLLLFLFVSLLGPALEEFLFRGLLYRSLRNLWPPAPAILISAVFFSAIHPSPATLLPVALLGIVLAYLYEKTGSIVPGMVAHSLYNTSVLASCFWLQHLIG